MKRKIKLFFVMWVCFVVFNGSSTHAFMQRHSQDKVGFLVVAPDRGFRGNNETQAVFEEFSKSYPAAMALIGNDYNGVRSGYPDYFSKAVRELRQAGTTIIVVIPLFLSGADPAMKKIAPLLQVHVPEDNIRWAAPMVESHLTAQILLDRVEGMSLDPEQERLIMIGTGAIDETSEQALKADLERLLEYVNRYGHFKETQAAVYYDRSAEDELREKKNKEVDELIIRTAAKKGRTLLVPAFIGPKFDHRMALTARIGRKFKDMDVAFNGDELMPHPNILLWLKKTANQYITVSSSEIGVVIMPHGSTRPYNDVVEEVISPLKTHYHIEMAYGMGDPGIIQQAVSRLEKEGARRIVFVRMYALADHMKASTDYILGLSDSPHSHGDDTPPPQVRSAAIFSSFGGYEENPGIAHVLYERIKEISRDPSRETVVLVAHGANADEDDHAWLQVMEANAERVREMTETPFHRIKVATVREDWPEKREKAVALLKEMIREGNHEGRVLLISNRLCGSGPYKELLEGMEYEMNEKGFAPHPILTRWIEDGIRRSVSEMTESVSAILSDREAGNAALMR